MNNRTIKAIPTEYDGVVFRSRMEARFAKWCDSWGIQWCYEPEGYEFGGERYLPDFYLPESGIIIEVKPVIASNELSKIRRLMKHISVRPDNDDLFEKERKEAWVVQVDQKGCIFTACHVDYGWEDKLGDGHDAGPVLCHQCNKPYIIGWAMWDCRHCGYYDGDSSFQKNLEWGWSCKWGYESKGNFVPYGNK